jgi:hypothetical protein
MELSFVIVTSAILSHAVALGGGLVAFVGRERELVTLNRLLRTVESEVGSSRPGAMPAHPWVPADRQVELG